MLIEASEKSVRKRPKDYVARKLDAEKLDAETQWYLQVSAVIFPYKFN